MESIFNAIKDFATGMWAALMNITDTEMYSFIFVGVGAVVIIAFERIKPYKPEQKFFRKQLFNDFVMYSIFQNYFLGLLFANFVDWIDATTGIRQMGILSDTPVWAIVLGSLIFHDLYIYWFHKWMHYNNYLWRLHEAHHSTVEMDWLSGSRSHAIEIFINQTVEFGILILLGAPAEALVIKGAISAVWGMWIHANVDVNTGRLQYIINGPEMHRWHHADKDPEAYNMNFATKFAFWDWIFNTAYLPKDKRIKYYGISNPFPENWFEQFFAAFRKFDPNVEDLIEKKK